jgi:DNA polymerase/3'-5' exonuclease PolX
MSEGVALPNAVAREIAEDLVVELGPFCERIEIAGSLRRQRHTVNDIELVAIPRWEEQPGPALLFGSPPAVSVNRLAVAVRASRKLVPADLASGKPREIRDDGRYWKLRLVTPAVQVDLFVTTPERWGLILFIRTGPAEFGREALARWKRMTDGGFSRDAQLHDGGGRIVPTPEEHDVFRELGMSWIEPSGR